VGARFEILVRMEHEGKILPPGAFLPAAERYNMIRLLDRWVVEESLRWLTAHPDTLSKLEQVNINLNSQTLEETDFEDFLLELFAAHAIPIEKICFEITENSAISNIGPTSVFLNRMQEKGFQFALDDFGSGFSSYSYLRKLPVNTVKIDGSFIRNVDKDPVNFAMVKSISQVAHTMGLSVVAEFVENQQTMEKLKGIGGRLCAGLIYP